MSLWWTKREQLDKHQIELIESVSLRSNTLILGPPGSGKTNVLLRRAQFVRGQDMPNVLVLTFTRPLTEFIRTGCHDAQGREIFPASCVTTLESWQRALYARHGKALPENSGGDLIAWKRQLSLGALALIAKRRFPKYDALFVDEAQDLLEEEVKLLGGFTEVLFLVGDDRQKIYEHMEGLEAVRRLVPALTERNLPFHYRVAPEICEVADRILLPHGGNSLASTAHYDGPRPARVSIASAPADKNSQLVVTAERLKEQIRVYADLIQQGDRLGVIVARKSDRDVVYEFLQNDPALKGKSKIVRAREDENDEYDPSFATDTPICILTVKGCKGLEFRAVHWLFADELSHHHNAEHYYTVITRAKTSLDILYTNRLTDILARAHAEQGVTPW